MGLNGIFNATKLYHTTVNKLFKMLITDRHPFNGLFSRKTWVSRHQKG